SSSEPRPAGLEESDQSSMSGEQGMNLDNSGPKLPDFASRPPGRYPSQPVEQRPLQQMPPQLMPHTQQPQPQQQPPPQPPPQQAQAPPQTPQQQQQMMMMLMMQQDPKSVRLPVPQGVHPPRGPLNPDAQRMPVQQGGNVPVMVNLQGPGPVPPSPDKQRIALPGNPPLGNNARKMVYQDNVQNPSSSPLGEVSSVSSLPEGGGAEGPPVSGAQNNLTSHLVVSQNQLMMTGPKPGPSPLSTAQGASPQQQSNSLPSTLTHHFPNVATPSQTSRPKTPNRASPRPYYPQTPNNRPPSTEPSEISLSPERLNASIAGLFPPQINIPLPPRPSLNRGFDQQGLNPTTLKAIGQAPSNLTINNQSSFTAPQAHKLEGMVINSGKQTNTGGTKRASPSNSRRSSPGSSRKTTPSPGRQNSKAAKLSLTTQQNPPLLQNMELQRNMIAGPSSLPTPVTTSFQNNNTLSSQNPAVSVPAMTGLPEDNKESLSVPPDNECQSAQGVQANKDQPSTELKILPTTPEMKMLGPEEQLKKDGEALDTSKLPVLEESKTIVSPAMREAPTSLSQLLDNSGAPNVTIKPPGLTGLEMAPVVTTGEELKKIAVIPPLQDSSSGKEPSNSLSLPQNNEPNSNPGHQEPGEMNSSVAQSVPPVMQRPVSSSISGPLPPNQITVFVTSNPITSSANTSAPLPSHLQPALVSTVVTMPNVGNKVMVSEGQSAVQSNPRPQFITPVFINSSSIIQVMKGSQSSTMPAAPMTSNSSLMPQSVAVVGPLHIPQNIKFSGSAPPSTSSSSPVSSIPTSRPLVLNPLAPPVQLPSPATTSSSVPSHLPAQQVKDFSPEETTSQSGGSSDQCSVTAAQPGPVVSPLLTSSPGSGNRRSPVSSSKGKGKVDKIGQLLLTKACKKVTGSLEKGEEQYAVDGEGEGQGLEASVPNSLGTEPSPAELENKTVTPSAPSLTKQSTSGPGGSSVGAAAAAPASTPPSVSASPAPASALPVAPAATAPEPAAAAPSTNGGSHGGVGAEQPAGGAAEEQAGAHQELLQSAGESGATLLAGKRGECSCELPTNILSHFISNETKENCEKSKTPNRRNSRTEDSAASQETVENGQRKRSSRPASASSTAKETSASAMQSKRRKSK
ncbi:NCOA6 protein, partial [Pluvianellus socialis]|nr:NCOA6 protein [Pluvianellus socialis]